MEIMYGGVQDNIPSGPFACALGFFDGVHIGHQNLIAALKKVSANKNYKSMVFTFEKHPLSFLNRENAPKLITDNCAKSQIFEQTGVDLLYFSKIDSDFLSTKPEEFLTEILMKKLNIRAIVAGFNFRFGCKGEGNADYLLEYGKRMGIDINIVEPIFSDGQLVSSTTIRNLLKQGNMEMANKFLGRHYSIQGKVVHGKARGRMMGLPTANVTANPCLILPKSGVYVTKVYIEDSHSYNIGITNIGSNPTFGNNSVTIETHIIDFNQDIYGKNIKIDFYHRIRDERAFEKASDLSEQINNDKQYAIEFFN